MARTAFTSVHGTCIVPEVLVMVITPAVESDCGLTVTAALSTVTDSVISPVSPGPSVSICGDTVAVTPVAVDVLSVQVMLWPRPLVR